MLSLNRPSPPLRLRLAAGFFCGLAAMCLGSLAPAAERLPNIVFILADDLGYGDLGSYGQEKIRTPSLDALAARGMRFTQHYSGSPVCAPARCVLMTGKHPGHAFIRSNGFMPPEGQRPIPEEEVTLAEVLKERGYRTGAFGKWGLGFVGTTGDPLNQGFDRFFGYNCQRHAHNYYPTYLWDDDRRILLNNHDFEAHQPLPEDADPEDPASYAAYQGRDYGPDLCLREALGFIRENRDQPFFVYYPTTVPHVALQVPDDSLAEYLGKWDDAPYTGHSNGYLPHRYPRAAYAAMITRMDRDVGRIIDLIRELGQEDNTIFVFTSDNGGTRSSGGADGEFFRTNGPLRDFKGSLYEGGIRVPMIAAWDGRIPAGTVSDLVTGFEDWIPTLLELIGAPDLVPPGIDGISFAPTLRGGRQAPRPFLYREYAPRGGQQFVRIGDWKGIRQNLISGPGAPNLKVELYNLKEDIGETRDVSAQHPEIVRQIERTMLEQRFPSEFYRIPVLDRQAQDRTAATR